MGGESQFVYVVLEPFLSVSTDPGWLLSLLMVIILLRLQHFSDTAIEITRKLNANAELFQAGYRGGTAKG